MTRNPLVKVLAELQTSQGFETQKTSEVGTEEDVKTNAKTRCQLVVETRTKFVHVFVTLNLLLSLTNHLVYYYLINWRVRGKKIEHLVESRSSSAEEVTLDRGQSSEWISNGSGIRDEKSFSVSSKSENFQL